MELSRERKDKFHSDLIAALDTMENKLNVEEFPEGRELLLYTLKLVKRDLHG